MTLSLLRVIQDIADGCIENLTVDELGFILTTFRDNCLNDDTFEVLDKILKSIYEID